MKKPVSAAKPDAALPARAPRRAGRRPKNADDGTPELSRAVIIDCAVKLAQKESLEEISMVRLARELGVTPALIHYYMGSREDLLSAVLNNAFRDRLSALPPLTGHWRHDLEAIAHATSKTHARWPGLASYTARHNRFRLFQKVSEGDTDYGLMFFDHVGRILRDGGFTASQAALVYHLLMTFLVSIGTTMANRQSPKDHEDFIVGYLSRHDPKQIPGASFMMKPFAKIDAPVSLEAGLKVLLDGFQEWLEKPAAAAGAKASAARKAAEGSRPARAARARAG